MADYLLQQATQSAPAVGGGAIGVFIAIATGLKIFATPKDIDLAKEQIRSEMAEKYAHKDELGRMGDDLTYIRQRIDQIVDKK